MSNGLPPEFEELVARQSAKVMQGRDNLNPDTYRTRYLYSSYLFAPGLGGSIAANEYAVFVGVKGDQGAQGYADRLTDRETNWDGKGGQLPDWQNIVAWELFVDVRRPPSDTSAYASGVQPTGAPTTGKVDLREPVNANDVRLICENVLVKIYRGPNRSEIIGRVGDFPAPGGVFGGVQASRQTPITGSAGIAGTDITTDPNTSRAYTPITRNAVAVGCARRFKVPRLLGRQSKFYVSFVVPAALTLQDKNGVTAANNNATGAVELVCGLWAVETFPAG